MNENKKIFNYWRKESKRVHEELIWNDDLNIRVGNSKENEIRKCGEIVINENGRMCNISVGNMSINIIQKLERPFMYCFNPL